MLAGSPRWRWSSSISSRTSDSHEDAWTRVDVSGLIVARTLRWSRMEVMRDEEPMSRQVPDTIIFTYNFIHMIISRFLIGQSETRKKLMFPWESAQPN